MPPGLSLLHSNSTPARPLPDLPNTHHWRFLLEKAIMDKTDLQGQEIALQECQEPLLLLALFHQLSETPNQQPCGRHYQPGFASIPTQSQSRGWTLMIPPLYEKKGGRVGPESCEARGASLEQEWG